ncbi:MAG TPA: ribonuclease III [Coriobacteriia bacterium]|nr:ribonuclease III [Coriobacteriia bacterium]
MPGRDPLITRAQTVLGHKFADPNLLLTALTHPSAAASRAEAFGHQRLEFLGDAVVGLVVVDELFSRFPDRSEGELTRLKVRLVSGDTLALVAERVGLGGLLILGESELGAGSRGLRSALENAYEACVGALYVDGGLAAARAFVTATLGPYLTDDVLGPHDRDTDHPKTRLQEIAQAGGRTVEYRIVSVHGPPHDRTFAAEVSVDGDVLGIGSGPTKKEAEMRAASEALGKILPG